MPAVVIFNHTGPTHKLGPRQELSVCSDKESQIKRQFQGLMGGMTEVVLGAKRAQGGGARALCTGAI